MNKGGAAKGTKYMSKGGMAKGKSKGTKYMSKGGGASSKGTKYMSKGGRIGKTKGVARGMGAAIRGGDFSI